MFFSATLDPELVAAASAAASTLPNRSQAESELLKQLRHHEAISEAQKKGDVNDLGYVSFHDFCLDSECPHSHITDINRHESNNRLCSFREIIADMKVGKYSNRQNIWRSNQIQFDEDGQGYKRDRGITAELDSIQSK